MNKHPSKNEILSLIEKTMRIMKAQAMESMTETLKGYIERKFDEYRNGMAVNRKAVCCRKMDAVISSLLLGSETSGQEELRFDFHGHPVIYCPFCGVRGLTPQSQK